MFVQDMKYLVINHQQTTSPQNAHRSLCNDCHKQLVCCFIEYCSYQSSLCLPVSQVYKGERWNVFSIYSWYFILSVCTYQQLTKMRSTAKSLTMNSVWKKIAEKVKYIHDLQNNTTRGKKSWRESRSRSYFSTERSFWSNPCDLDDSSTPVQSSWLCWRKLNYWKKSQRICRKVFNSVENLPNLIKTVLTQCIQQKKGAGLSYCVQNSLKSYRTIV